MKSVIPELQTALDAAEIIELHKPDRPEEFLESLIVQDAICMRLQQLEDSLSQIRRQFTIFYEMEKTRNWDHMIGFRNVVAHRYQAVDMITVWNIVDVHLPVLVSELEETLERAKRGPNF